ncbi:hypothetical protein GF323_00785 [Candidatus Woesearchaeota archaeon]|nr:hypothetical protein [Candidatus Woesearchaeota archaeon]
MMKKRLVLLSAVLLLIACTEEEYLLCPDNVTRVLSLEDCPEEREECPECDDYDNCTRDICNAGTDYKCEYREIKPCDGNGICEEGEFPWSGDCPDSCNDNDECTKDSYNYAEERCLYEDIIPCCGNDACETGETYIGCPPDCEQRLDLSVTHYAKRKQMANSEIDLRNTDYFFVVVEFKLHNLGMDEPETLNYKTEKGFFYDPFKMRLQDETGRFYKPEYDSDFLTGWRDIDIIPKGDKVGAALLFIVPVHTEHVQLVAYDKYGSKLDVSEVY